MRDTLSSLVHSLRPLCLYELDSDSTNISYELSAYALVFDELNAEIVKMLRECFIASADDYGIENRELIIGALRDDLPLSKRRSMLSLRENIDLNSFTVPKIKQALKSFGLECTVHEYPSIYTVVVDAVGSYTEPEKAWIRNQVEQIMPAHLLVQVVFGGPTWDLSDSKENTFADIDSLDYSWEYIDNIK